MFGIGEGPVHLSRVQCTGTEDSIFDCDHISSTDQNFQCNQSEPVGVICNVTEETGLDNASPTPSSTQSSTPSASPGVISGISSFTVAMKSPSINFHTETEVTTIAFTTTDNPSSDTTAIILVIFGVLVVLSMLIAGAMVTYVVATSLKRHSKKTTVEEKLPE